jgi:dsRNA-specific ribonuclease
METFKIKTRKSRQDSSVIAWQILVRGEVVATGWAGSRKSAKIEACYAALGLGLVK